ncbi:hypothetical protein GMORB2_7416 [Geosmithia morbida]|uniref:Uncharacterized protein n=1 Tax=Geosmithia morbida TaxID=1094350 RepID=A0A9P4YV90_9HYPO|nr:uncharacterized protein GMORB2_7416 [Geosmithia morbida]KAF4122424.1 hypothetical protein GMORB2_7416 [Geosmithia morbida]
MTSIGSGSVLGAGSARTGAGGGEGGGQGSMTTGGSIGAGGGGGGGLGGMMRVMLVFTVVMSGSGCWRYTRFLAPGRAHSS